MKGGKRKKQNRNSFRRHSAYCPCREHIRAQTQYFASNLRRLGGGSVKKIDNLIAASDPCFIRFIGKCANGILRDKIQLPSTDYEQLKPVTKSLIKLAHPNTTIGQKRILLKQRQQGGGAFPLLPILGSLAATLLSNLIAKK